MQPKPSAIAEPASAPPATCAACAGAMVREKPWLARCPGCGFLASSLEAGAGTGIAGLEALRRANFEVLLDRLARHRAIAGARVLEVGSAWGWFLEAARRRGALVHGIEPEAANAALARANGFEVETGLFPQDLRHRGPYDIIAFNDVLEHIPDPAAALRAVEQLLAPGGLAVVNLPSSDGTIYRIARGLDRLGVHGPYERLWQKGFPSPHVSYFNPANLQTLAERHCGLRRIDGFHLQSVMRQGLYARVRSSNGPAMSLILTGALHALAGILRHLPADIHVAVLERQA